MSTCWSMKETYILMFWASLQSHSHSFGKDNHLPLIWRIPQLQCFPQLCTWEPWYVVSTLAKHLFTPNITSNLQSITILMIKCKVTQVPLQMCDCRPHAHWCKDRHVWSLHKIVCHPKHVKCALQNTLQNASNNKTITREVSGVSYKPVVLTLPSAVNF